MIFKLFQDLRSVIGVFFLVLGVVLLVTSFFGPSDVVDGIRLNLFSGSVMVLFGASMVALTLGRES